MQLLFIILPCHRGTFVHLLLLVLSSVSQTSGFHHFHTVLCVFLCVTLFLLIFHPQINKTGRISMRPLLNVKPKKHSKPLH